MAIGFLLNITDLLRSKKIRETAEAGETAEIEETTEAI
jgi:hypothetical protein